MMLILMRRRNETVRIGKDVVVRVLSIRGQAVELGFEAPREVTITRSELLDREVGKQFARDDGVLGRGEKVLPPHS